MSVNPLGLVCLGLFLLLVGSVALFAFVGYKINEKAEKENRFQAKQLAQRQQKLMTNEKFQKMQLGMSYDQIVTSFGPPDSQFGATLLDGKETCVYVWKGNNIAQANLTFHDGILIAKNQFGL